MSKSIVSLATLTFMLTLAACGKPPMEQSEMTNPGNAQLAANVDFGDDSSEWANDDECDDPRFQGPGMTSTALLDADIKHDATDCRKDFEAGKLQLAPARGAAQPPMAANLMTKPGNAKLAATVDFGDDSSEWSKDDECDDPRFEGPGMTDTALLADDIKHDATDCRAAFEAGKLQVR